MRYGISWDLNAADFSSAEQMYQAIFDEVVCADGNAINSIWVEESRDSMGSISSPSMFLTNLAPRSKNVQLGVKNRQLLRSEPVRMAEEFATLDHFSRGRAAIAFEAASRQGLEPQQLHETLEFIQAAWARDNFRYRGDYVKFPSSVPADAPKGVSVQPPSDEPFVPQWYRQNALQDFIAVRPKPYAPRPLIHVSIEDDATLAWAAKKGFSPIFYADQPTQAVLARADEYAAKLAEAGRDLSEVEIVIERDIHIDGSSSETALGGNVEELATAIRKLGDQTQMSHLIWRRQSLGADQLVNFVNGIMLGVQA